MKRFKSSIIIALVVLMAAIFVAPTPAAHADSASLSITPKKNYVIDAGKSVKDTISIHNLDANSDLQLTLRVIDFSYTDDGGTPKLMLAADAPQTTWSLKPYLTVPETVTIPAGGTKAINMSVAIPAKVGAGSYYSAVLYSTGAPDGGNVGLAASGVTLVFVSVPGQVNENLTLQKFGAYNNNVSPGKYVSITTDMPFNLGYTLKNSGNVTESPVGTIKLQYMFGKIRTIDNINPSGSLALIDQTRTFTTCIKLKSESVDFNGSASETNTCVNPGLWPGRYTASIDAFYGQNGNQTQEITKTVHFWYLPYWFVIVAIVVILILALVIWRLVVKIRGLLYGPRRHKSSFKRRR